MDKRDEFLQLTKTCEELTLTINELKEENAFLTETIINSKIGTIAVERKQMLEKILKAEIDTESAATTQADYEQKLNKIAFLIKDIEGKQTDIDDYINKIVEERIANIKSEYARRKKFNDKVLERSKSKNDLALQRTIKKYKQQNMFAIIFGIIGIVIGITSFM